MLITYRTVELVDYQGNSYPLESLMRRLSLEYLRELQHEAPRSGQEAWDLVTMHWPALADSIAHGVKPVSSIS